MEKMQNVFIINGPGGVGKDAFIAEVAKYTERAIANYSSIDKVKEILRIIGWDGVSKTERDRKMMADLKQLCVAYNDMPFKCMEEKVEEFRTTDGLALFLHIREPEEIEKARVAFGAKTLLIKRDSVVQITSNNSDKNVYNYDYDIVINNDGTIEELSAKAKCFCEDCLNNTLKSTY